MLFAPPRPPLCLDPEREIVMGRSRHCELTLDVAHASRRHAAVRFQDGRFRVRDLDSTNGTLLNGEPLRGERTLQRGDRIGIGGTSVTFCQVGDALEEAVGDPCEGDTVLMAQPWSGTTDALRGDLEQIPSFAVLQILEMGSHTGLLSVETSDGTSQLWLENGRLVHAETEKRQGLDAAIEMVQSTSGQFLFEPGRAPAERSMDASVTELILEASRLLDEATAGR